jgi:hypothetical protein
MAQSRKRGGPRGPRGHTQAQRSSRGPDSKRDQHESAFTAILGALVARVPGARAAILVDFEGETVDYAGSVDPYASKVAAAHWCVVLDGITTRAALSPARWVWLRAGRSSYLVHALPDGYALVLVLTRAAGFVGWRRAVAACARSIGVEAGWAWGKSPAGAWYSVDIVSDDRRRPAGLRMAGQLHRVDILGAVAGGLGRGERAWRAHFHTGVDATLVREPGGAWYVDERIEIEPPRTAPPRRDSARPREPTPEPSPRRELPSPGPQASPPAAPPAEAPPGPAPSLPTAPGAAEGQGEGGLGRGDAIVDLGTGAARSRPRPAPREGTDDDKGRVSHSRIRSTTRQKTR